MINKLSFYLCNVACDVISETRDRQVLNSTNNYLFRSVTFCIIHNTTQPTVHTNIQTDVPSHVKLTVILRDFVAYGFRDRKVKRWLSAGTWHHANCPEMLLSYRRLYQFNSCCLPVHSLGLADFVLLNIKYFIVQRMHSIIWIVGLLKTH